MLRHSHDCRQTHQLTSCVSVILTYKMEKKKNLDAEVTNSNPTLNALFVHFGLEGRKSRLYLLKQVMGRVILLGCN